MSKHLIDIIFCAEKKSREIDNALPVDQAAILKAELFKAITLYSRINHIFISTPNFDAQMEAAMSGNINYDSIFTAPGYRNEDSINSVLDSLNCALANPGGVSTAGRSNEPEARSIHSIRRATARNFMMKSSVNLQASLYKILTLDDYTLNLKASEVANRIIDIVTTAAGTAIKSTPAGVAYSLGGYIKSMLQIRKSQSADSTAVQKSQGKSSAVKTTAMTTAGLAATAATTLGAPVVAGIGVAAATSLALYAVSTQGYALVKRLRNNKNAYADLLSALLTWNEYAIYIVASTDDGRDWVSADLGALGDVQNGTTHNRAI